MNILKIVYLILSYLYESLKAGKVYISTEELKIRAITDDIPESYFISILQDIEDEGYIKTVKESVKYVHQKNVDIIIALKINMKGVEYLKDNSAMKKVAEFLKTVKEITPMI